MKHNNYLFLFILTGLLILAACTSTETTTVAPTPTPTPSVAPSPSPTPSPSPAVMPKKIDGLVIVEAETFTGEEGGKARPLEGRTNSTENVCIGYWDETGHNLEWQFEIPQTAEYAIVLRYCHNRGSNSLREFLIDGKSPGAAFAKTAFATTGGWSKGADDWKSVPVADKSGAPVYINLTAGRHKIKLSNLGSDGADRGTINLDVIAFVRKDLSLAKINDLILEAAPALAVVKEVPKGTIPAFPGAEGAGRFALGGRGGKVFEVTNLDDDGPGSLRDAIMARGPRIVVFRVSGTIALKSPIDITNANITIAGQTAPGDGITVKNFPFRAAADNVVIRFIRSRLGDEMKQETDSMGILQGKYIILDHCSASWSVDEVLSTDSPAPTTDAITVQWSFITESLRCSVHAKGCHGYGSLIRGANGIRVSYLNNLYAHNAARNPRPGNYLSYVADPVGLRFDFVNNVVYDWGGDHAGYNADSDSISTMNFVGNYYIAGANSLRNIAFDEACAYNKSYFADNYMNGAKPKDPWSLVNFSGVPESMRKDYKLSKPVNFEGITVEDGAAAYKKVLQQAGCSLPARDAVDIRIVKDVENKSGSFINHPNDVGGWPVLKSGTPLIDSDHDGMPDAWEKANKLDPNVDDSAGDINGNGYTNIEDYINSLVKW